MSIIMILLTIISGCNKSNEQSKSDEENKVPPGLEKLQQLSEEVVLTSMGQNWSVSLDKTNELQTSWSELYPELQKQGVPKEDVDAFVENLNRLTDSLISKNLNEPQQAKPDDSGSKSIQEQQQSQSQKDGQEESQKQKEGQEDNQGQKEDQDQGGDEEKKQSDKEDTQKEEENKQNQDQQNQKTESPGATEAEGKDSKSVLEKIDPMISVAKEDLQIINSSVEVTKYIPEFMSLFKSTVPPNIYKLKYFVRHLTIAAKQESWEEVSTSFDEFKQLWDTVESDATEADSDLKIQLKQGIDELENVIKTENVNLVGIKSNLLIGNIESLIKKIEEKEKEKKKEEQ